MPRSRKPKSTIPGTITWPPETGIDGNIDPAIDESTSKITRLKATTKQW